MFYQKHESCKYVLPLQNWIDWITIWRETNVATLKMYILKKSSLKLKKTWFFPLMTTFYNFALTIETSQANKVVKHILEAWNGANDVIVNVWFIHSRIKNLKNMQCKKE